LQHLDEVHFPVLEQRLEKSGGVKLVVWVSSHLIGRRRSWKCFRDV